MLLLLWMGLACGTRAADSGGGPSDDTQDSGLSGDTGWVETALEDSSLVGVGAKGPYAKDAIIRVFKVDDQGALTTVRQFGRTNKDGRLLLPPLLFDGWCDVSVEGAAFDELVGDVDKEQGWDLGVLAQVDRSDGHSRIVANVNLLTHLQRARARTLLQASPGDFDAVMLQSHAELAAIWPIAHAPSLLSVTDSGGDGLSADNAVLLSLSVATLRAGFGQAEIDLLAADFADDGQINGEAAGLLAALREATRETDYALAREHLLDRYGSAPPALPVETLRWTYGACSGDGEREAICLGTNSDLQTRIAAKSWGEFSFRAPHSGSFLVVGAFGSFNNFHRWTMVDDSGGFVATGVSTSSHSAVTVGLTPGDWTVLSAYNAGDSETFVDLSLHSASVGTAEHPAPLLVGVAHEGSVALANAGGGGGTRSYYVVDSSQLAHDATLRVTVSDVASDLRLTAYAGDHGTNPLEVIGDSEAMLGLDAGTGGVSLSGLAVDQRVYLVVEALDGGFDPTSSVPGLVAYRIKAE
ncbi:MAG: hypothetical protein VX899_11220 [Myxococcota bacterium]|nr:hypothetical protein [Myxococcota bacterium]